MKYKNLVPENKVFGGERGIRTLERVLAVTRFPVVRLRPAQPPFHVTFPAYVGYSIRFLRSRVTVYHKYFGIARVF